MLSRSQKRRCVDACIQINSCMGLVLWTYPLQGGESPRDRNGRTSQLIDLRIAMESVLLSENKGTGEKRHQLATRGAWYLGKTVDQRRQIYDTLRYVYDYASSVIHGGKPKPKQGQTH